MSRIRIKTTDLEIVHVSAKENLGQLDHLIVLLLHVNIKVKLEQVLQKTGVCIVHLNHSFPPYPPPSQQLKFIFFYS